MANDIKQRIILEGEKEYKAALQDANRNLKTLRSALKAETAELGANATAQQKNQVKVKNLQKQIKEQEKVVNTYREALEEVREKYGDNADAIAKYEQKLNDARTALANMKNQIDATGNSFKSIESGARQSVTETAALALSFEKISGAAQTMSDACEGIFTGLLGSIRGVISSVWGEIMEVASLADDYTDLAYYLGASTTDVQKWSNAMKSAGGSLSSVTSLITKLRYGGTADKVTEWFGISAENYDNDLLYIQAVLQQMYKWRSVMKENGTWTEAMVDIFGAKKVKEVDDILGDWDDILPMLQHYDVEQGGIGLTEEEISDMNTLAQTVRQLLTDWETLKQMAVVKLFGSVALDLTSNAQGALDSLIELMNATTDEERNAAIEKFQEKLEGIFKSIGEAIASAGEALDKAGGTLKGSENGYVKLMGDILSTVGSVLTWLADESHINLVVGAVEALFAVWVGDKALAFLGNLQSASEWITNIFQNRKAPNIDWGNGGNGGDGGTGNTGTENVQTENVSTENVTTQNVTTQNVTTGNTTTGNVQNETVTNGTFTKADFATVSTTTENVQTMYVENMIGGNGGNPKVTPTPTKKFWKDPDYEYQKLMGESGAGNGLPSGYGNGLPSGYGNGLTAGEEPLKIGSGDTQLLLGDGSPDVVNIDTVNTEGMVNAANGKIVADQAFADFSAEYAAAHPKANAIIEKLTSPEGLLTLGIMAGIPLASEFLEDAKRREMGEEKYGEAYRTFTAREKRIANGTGPAVLAGDAETAEDIKDAAERQKKLDKALRPGWLAWTVDVQDAIDNAADSVGQVASDVYANTKKAFELPFDLLNHYVFGNTGKGADYDHAMDVATDVAMTIVGNWFSTAASDVGNWFSTDFVDVMEKLSRAIPVILHGPQENGEYDTDYTWAQWIDSWGTDKWVENGSRGLSDANLALINALVGMSVSSGLSEFDVLVDDIVTDVVEGVTEDINLHTPIHSTYGVPGGGSPHTNYVEDIENWGVWGPGRSGTYTFADWWTEHSTPGETQSMKSIMAGLPQSIQNGMKNIKVVMDGQEVGYLVTPYVSQEIARAAG